MKIKSQYPAIVTNNSQKVLDSLLNKGFKIIHCQKDILFEGNIEYVLRHTSSATKMDVVQANVDFEKQGLRLNVNDVQEAIDEFSKDGFKLIAGPQANDYSISALMKDPDGLVIYIMQHRR